MTNHNMPSSGRLDVLDAIRRACDSDALPYEIYGIVTELLEDANRWRAVTDIYAGFQSRGGQMVAYISTPQWRGDWADLNDAIDRHFEINSNAITEQQS